MKLYRNNFYLSIFMLTLGLNACNNELDIPEPINDDPIIEQFLADNNINATKSDEWDVYYIELEPGNGEAVQRTSVVEIDYEYSLLDGSLLATDSSYTFVPEVYSFIPGIALGALTMTEEGKSLIIIPSKYAYGSDTGTLNGVVVPPNAILQATITVKAVRDRDEQKLWEVGKIEEYITANELTEASGDSDGLYKQILSEGTGEETPADGNSITVEYEGSFLDGTIFDSSENAQFNLTANGLIEGFYDGVLTMKRDEEAVFMMTSDLAYGDNGSNSIPPFTPLVFKIKLIDF